MTTYTIEKISDLLAVPNEKREECVKDLLYGLALHEMAFGLEAINMPFGAVEWTDDGDSSITLNDKNGDVFLSLKMEKS